MCELASSPTVAWEPSTTSFAPLRPLPPTVNFVPLDAVMVKPAPVIVSPVPLVSEILSPELALIAPFEPLTLTVATSRISSVPAAVNSIGTLTEEPASISNTPPSMTTWPGTDEPETPSATSADSLTVPSWPASMVPPGGEPDDGWPVSTLESIARIASSSASSNPPPSLIVWLPVFRVRVTPEPEATDRAGIDERQIVGRFDSLVADLSGGARLDGAFVGERRRRIPVAGDLGAGPFQIDVAAPVMV